MPTGYKLLSKYNNSNNICTKYLDDKSKKAITNEKNTGIDLIIVVGS